MHVSDEAYARIRRIITEDEDIPDTASVRVYVTGGGCSGFQYGFEIVEKIEEDDTVIEQDGARLVIDPMSYTYLANATLNYTSNINGESFVIDNPDAVRTCGCSSSFEM